MKSLSPSRVPVFISIFPNAGLLGIAVASVFAMFTGCTYTKDLTCEETRSLLRTDSALWMERAMVHSGNTIYTFESGKARIVDDSSDKSIQGKGISTRSIGSSEYRIRLTEVDRIAYDCTRTVRLRDSTELLAEAGKWYFEFGSGKAHSIVLMDTKAGTNKAGTLADTNRIDIGNVLNFGRKLLRPRAVLIPFGLLVLSAGGGSSKDSGGWISGPSSGGALAAPVLLAGIVATLFLIP